MLDIASGLSDYGYWWAVGNFFVFLAAFLTALYFNFNFNMVMVGLIYLAPLVPIGFDEENAGHFHRHVHGVDVGTHLTWLKILQKQIKSHSTIGQDVV